MAIRVGLIGLNHGERVHLPAYANNPKYEVVAVCARSPGRAEAVAREHKLAAWYSDPRQLIAAPDLDLVSIATPPGSHAGLAAAALAAGKHAVVEIAFTPSLADARILTQMARERGRVGAAAFVLRFVPNLRLVADLLAQRAIGQPRLMRLDYFSSFLTRGQAEWRWMLEAETGGGVLAGFISHAFDLTRQWFGPVREVQATLRTFADASRLPPGRTAADDTGMVTLQLQSGLLAAFNFSAAVAYPRVRFELHGSAGTLLIEGFGDEVMLLPLGEPAPRRLYPPAAYLEETRGQSGLPAGFHYFLELLAPALSGGRALSELPTFADGLDVSRVLEAVRLAARERRAVRVEEVG
jgi:predicted dehydrogenase